MLINNSELGGGIMRGVLLARGSSAGVPPALLHTIRIGARAITRSDPDFSVCC
jgi:hypothetical protein